MGPILRREPGRLRGRVQSGLTAQSLSLYSQSAVALSPIQRPRSQSERSQFGSAVTRIVVESTSVTSAIPVPAAVGTWVVEDLTPFELLRWAHGPRYKGVELRWARGPQLEGRELRWARWPPVTAEVEVGAWPPAQTVNLRWAHGPQIAAKGL
jgi:hypothetical protein